MLKILSLSEMLPVYLVDRLYLSVATDTAYLISSGFPRKFIAICEKFAAEFSKPPAEFGKMCCGKL